jgi:carbonic anhydrase
MTKTKTNIESIDKELSTMVLKSDCIHEAIVENVNFQVSKALVKYKDKVTSGDLTIFGAIYDFKNDFGFGHGKVVLTSINGVNDSSLLKAQYKEYVKNIHFLK